MAIKAWLVTTIGHHITKGKLWKFNIVFIKVNSAYAIIVGIANNAKSKVEIQEVKAISNYEQIVRKCKNCCYLHVYFVRKLNLQTPFGHHLRAPPSMTVLM
jgi:hypothetical protein